MRLRRCVLLIVCAVGLQSATAAELIVLAPLKAGNQNVMRAGPKGEPQAPIMKRALANDPLTKAIARESTRGAVKFMLALDEQAQRLANVTMPSATYLFLSQEDGGFARRGFWLSDANNNVTWHSDPYVDLVVDQESINDGSFEEIFAHELGHVLLRRLLPRLPNGISRTAHSSLAITDYPTAFDEGFATHFQGLARVLTQNAKLKAIDAGLEFKPFLPYWQSNMDRTLRVRGMRDNLFIHLQAPTALNVGDATPLFDFTHFKNGQQMMSSEGVIATLFYQLMVRSTDAAAQRGERYKSLLASLRALNNQKLTASTPVFLHLVQTHIQRVPDEKATWLNTIMNVTYGATASTMVIHAMPNLSALGQENRGDEFRVALKQSRDMLAKLASQTIANPQRLGAALGPELWLAFKKADDVVTINVNTAEKTTLGDVLKFESTDADLLLADRSARGPFIDVADLCMRRKLSPFICQRLQDANKLAIKLGGFQRE